MLNIPEIPNRLSEAIVNQCFITVLAPVISLLLYWWLITISLPTPVAVTAAITTLTVIWWITEAIPIPATSLVPIALFPAFGVLDHKTAASSFGSPIILLFLGAFMLSKALEHSGAHKRLAMYMLSYIGASSGRRIVFGFMATTALLSMWVSNTATTLIMIPIALSVTAHIDHRELKVALILGVAYAASIGGIGTPIGSPPNLIFMGIYEEHTGNVFGFLDWMQIGFPIVLIALPLAALWLTRHIHIKTKITLPALGHWTKGESRTLWIFGLTGLAWMTSKAPFGGWSEAFNMPMVGDSTVALLAALLMFLVPDGKGSRLLDWDTAKTIPWGTLLLFAGGITIAKGFQSSGLSTLLGDGLSALATFPVIFMVLAIGVTVTYLTEITSNTATTALLMPILAAGAMAAGYDPVLFMMPAAICASCAFMLPVATPPNAIAYASGAITMRDMVRQGFILSAVLSCLVSLICAVYYS